MSQLFEQYQNFNEKNHKFEVKKSQSVLLLNKVKTHLQNSRKRRSKIQSLDLENIDKQMEFQHLQYLDNNADIDHQRLIDQCVKDILETNQPIEQPKEDYSPLARQSQRSSFSQGKSIPKHKMKKLRSSIIVEKLVREKGIQKKTVHQQQQDKLQEFIEQQQRQHTETQHERLPQIGVGKTSRLKILTLRVKSRKPQSNLGSQYDPSPLFDRQSTISMLSDSLDISTNQQIYNSGRISQQSNLKVESLIRQINQEKDQIITQQRNITQSLAIVQRKYDQIDYKNKPDKKEGFTYLKYEQKIFGKGKYKLL